MKLVSLALVGYIQNVGGIDEWDMDIIDFIMVINFNLGDKKDVRNVPSS